MKFLYQTILVIITLGVIIFITQGTNTSKETIKTEKTNVEPKNNSYSYVKPYATTTGRLRKGHFRKPVSTNKNAFKNRARSKYYYSTHKYAIKEKRRKKKS